MKTLFGWLLAAAMTASLLPTAPADAPELSARAAILMEADSGQVLLEENADEPMLIASTTKILTALLALERCDPDAEVAVEPAWTGVEGSSMYLAPGQELTVRELLYGLMLASGNDAAVALACLTSGSVESFAELMNEKAEALGCTHSHFTNPNGLDDEEHYSSARDLALITREALKDPAFREIVSARAVTVGENTYVNHNRLLSECEGVFGVKTGYTEAAGRTLVTCCERDGVTLICVTLSDPDDWQDHTALYDWAYGRYAQTELLPDDARWTLEVVGGAAGSVDVIPAEPLRVFPGSEGDTSLSVRLPRFVYAAVEEGAPAGEAVLLLNGEEAASVALVYAWSVPRAEERQSAGPRPGEREIYTLE